MAVLTSGQKRTIKRDYQGDLSRVREPCSVLKADIADAIDAVDVWVDVNKGSFNAALPVASRTGLTTEQKSRLLVAVITKRFLEGL